MRTRSHLLGVALLGGLALACTPDDARKAESAPEAGASAPAAGGAGAAGGEVAAEVQGVPITTAELDEWIKEDLFSSRASTPAKLYEMRAAALEAMLAERALEVLAESKGQTADELILAEVTRMGPVTDEEVQQFFDENEEQLGGATLEQVGPRIKDFLTARRSADAQAMLVEQVEVVTHLEPPRVEVAATGPAKGPAGAPVTIVEFSDFQCPFCRRVIPTLDKVLEKYPEDVRVVYRNMPLRNHTRARPAAEAALCADEQGKFWPYHDKLFENTRKLGDADLLQYAKDLELDAEAFQACVDENRFAKQVDQDMEDARAAGVSGTPAFFVNGVMISGAKPPEDFYRLIDAELERLAQRAGG